MKYVDSWWFPDGETHLPQWMANPKVRQIINGRAAYQGTKQLAVMNYVRPGKWMAVDVGAHVGLWSYNLARWFGHVYAYEPVAAHRECFAKNVEARNVTLFPCALGEKDGSVSMHTAPTSSGDSWMSGNGDIPMRRLDDFDLAQVDLLKIDIEGAELFVLRGAEQTLRRCRPALIVEQKPGHAQRFGFGERDAVPYLQSLGAKLRQEISGDFILSWDDDESVAVAA